MIVQARAASVVLAAVALCVTTSTALAQGTAPRPPGPFVIDLRGATSGVPSAAEFYPPIDDDADDGQDLVVPARGYGFEIGAHVYPFRLGPARVGIGVTFGRVRATAVSALPDDDSEDDANGDDETAEPATVDVIASGQTLAPQVSFNFGTADGWSYLSAGYGGAAFRTRVGTEQRETTGLSALNFGGGARWFFTDHLGVGFDVRWHKVASGDRTPGTTMFAAAVGLSVK